MKARYNIFFHQGPDLGLKTRVSKGTAWIDPTALKIQGQSGGPVITITGIQNVDLFRLHGSMRVIRVDHRDGRLFLSVVRLMIGQFAFVNFLKTGELHNALLELTHTLAN